MTTLEDLRFTRPVEAVRTLVAAAMVRPRPQDGPDIYIVSSPRSGSTWLMDALGAQPGFGCANEPLHKRRLELIPPRGFTPRWRYDRVAPDEADALRFHLTDRTSLRPFLNIHPLRHSFSRRPGRLVIKSVRAAPLLEWLVDNLPGHVIYLCRHPIPQAMSARRRGHAIRGLEYLERARAGRPTLRPEQLTRLAGWLECDDELVHRVVEWSLENVEAIRFAEQNRSRSGLSVVCYEDVTRDLAGVLRRLDKDVGLPDWTRSLPAASEPSRVSDSSTRESIQAIKNGNTGQLVRGWRSRLSKERVHALVQIPSALGIPLDPEDDSIRI